jgi:DnaK suppressor protein
MDAEKLKQYESALRELLVELEAHLEESRDERTPVAVDGRMGRVSRGDAMQVQQMAVEMARRREERLLRVQTALERVVGGAYGICGRCRRPISESRLDAMPEVVLCVRCAGAPSP